MSFHEQMSEEEVLRTMASVLSAWPVPGPPEAEAIMARRRARRHRRRAGVSLAATAAAHDELLAAPRGSRARALLTWQGPAVAVALILLVAAVLVGLRSLRNEHAAPVASPAPVAGAAPRYYVAFAGVKDSPGWSIIAGDRQAGKTIASFPLPQGDALTGAAVSGAADDRTFVVTGATGWSAAHRKGNRTATFGPAAWYLARIYPGSADPLRVTRLPLQAPSDGVVTAIALSGDGTELAVVSMSGRSSITLRTYSAATGRLQHVWVAAISSSADERSPVTGLRWVGNDTLGFTITYIPEVREEVRTLDISAAGTDLLGASRVVWSQRVPPPPRGVYQEGTPRACGTPLLSGNGQVVVCATSTYSASEKRLSATWLAYPVTAPARARVLGTIPQPHGVSSLSPVTVDWTNPSGTEVIGQWSPTAVTFPGTPHSVSVTTSYVGIIGGGTVRPLDVLTNHVPLLAAW